MKVNKTAYYQRIRMKDGDVILYSTNVLFLKGARNT